MLGASVCELYMTSNTAIKSSGKMKSDYICDLRKFTMFLYVAAFNR